MRSNYVDHYLSKTQNALYAGLHHVAERNVHVGRLSAIIVSPIDGCLQVLKTPLRTIEYLVNAILNLIGAAFSPKYNLEDALFSAKSVGINTISIFGVVPVVVFKILYQLIAIVRDPKSVQSIKNNNWGTPEDVLIEYTNWKHYLANGQYVPVCLMSSEERMQLKLFLHR